MLQTQPLTVLIVDDELPLREELRLFDWQDCCAELIGEAENGEEALELCRRLAPDVVITDITMPVMDGMDLFRRIKQEFPLTQVVLLTCHTDFAYAKEALKLGALEYLIKVSLLDSELQQVLDKAREAIQRERNYMRSELDRQRWELTRLLTSIGKEPEREGIREACGAVLRSWQVPFPVGILRLHVHVRAQEALFAHRELQALLSEWESNWAPGTLFRRWIAVGPHDYMLMERREADQVKGQQALSLLEQAGGWMRNLQSALDARISYLRQRAGLYAAAGTYVGAAADLSEALEQTKLPEAAFFYDGEGTVYAADALYRRYTAAEKGRVSEAEAKARTELEKQTELLRQAESSRESLAQYCRKDLFEWAVRFRPDPNALKAWLLSNLKLWKGHRDPLRRQEAAASFQAARTLAELISLIVREIEEQDGERPKQRKEVAMAMRLVSEHIAEPITLTWMADRVGLSSFYLSRLFREEVGESFNEYVTRIRIDKAIELLQTTSLKVYEVAEQIGIPSYRYFSVLFRNRTGVSPTEYKKGGAQ